MFECLQNIMIISFWKLLGNQQLQEINLLSCSFYLASNFFGLHCAQKIIEYLFLSPEFGGNLMTQRNWTHNLPFKNITTKLPQLGAFLPQENANHIEIGIFLQKYFWLIVHPLSTVLLFNVPFKLPAGFLVLLYTVIPCSQWHTEF